MDKKHTLAIAAITALLLTPAAAAWIPRPQKAQGPEADLARRQETWISALEWCESRGKENAVNPRDRDGTPSYGAFQFKPSTFAYFAKRYGIASTTDYMDASAQREIVRGMVRDLSDEELRARQFPDCIQHKIGTPPRK